MKRTYTQGKTAYEDMNYYSKLGYDVHLTCKAIGSETGYILVFVRTSQ